ncbi:hypothetical protein [Allobranchiibius sp. GilTou73]|uniref:hypothetical protein n=1 Tax=Allobranchiibius sp. GilTou73 TaxID=2904523 RepID=UPI001F41F7F9|nr:hypothetical protein [Allobranchiibius sp. GilTou73]UIJ36290.1 hypothetical protein LVQ62_07970 [Allobranchiibius sp. GilTou73]
MTHVSPEPKAAPSSDLNARQEALLWAGADVVFIVILLLLSATFLSVNSDSFLTATLIAPFVGWVIGNLLAFVVPRTISTPSWLIAIVALVLVVICAGVFHSGQGVIATGRGLAGLIIGLATGFLFLRAWRAEHQAHRAARETA